MRLVRAGGSDVAAAPPNGPGLADGMPGEAKPGLQPRHHRARERRPAAAVAPLVRSAFRDAPARALRGSSLPAGIPATRLLKTVPAGPGRSASRTASDFRGHRAPRPAFRPHPIPPFAGPPDRPPGAHRHRAGGGLPDTSDTTDNIVQDRHLGEILRVDFAERVLSPLRA